MDIVRHKYTKLNLACGSKVENKLPEPWLNVDLADGAADFICDITRLPIEWSNKFDEVRVSHVLEHFFLKEMFQILQEWTRVLAPDGILRIIVPDLKIVVAGLAIGQDSKERVSVSINKTTPILAQIYGVGYDDPQTENRWRHHFIFDEVTLIELLQRQPFLEKIVAYDQKDDPAGVMGINDDSQNPFSLCVMARKKR
jgi:SAM-dependent methyltransferase